MDLHFDLKDDFWLKIMEEVFFFCVICYMVGGGVIFFAGLGLGRGRFFLHFVFFG